MEVGLSYVKTGADGRHAVRRGIAARENFIRNCTGPMTQKTIYLLDEPTVGLHFEDVRKLIRSFEQIGRTRQHGRADRTQLGRDQVGGLSA